MFPAIPGAQPGLRPGRTVDDVTHLRGCAPGGLTRSTAPSIEAATIILSLGGPRPDRWMVVPVDARPASTPTGTARPPTTPQGLVSRSSRRSRPVGPRAHARSMDTGLEARLLGRRHGIVRT